LDVSPTTGTIKLNFPELEVWELAETCSLDIADAGPQPLERVSVLMNVTRERIRQIESVALARLGSLRDARALRDVEFTAP
jgi:DNA-directed RNA polymerase sigma subunit (sigma70/sigma32)